MPTLAAPQRAPIKRAHGAVGGGATVETARSHEFTHTVAAAAPNATAVGEDWAAERALAHRVQFLLAIGLAAGRQGRLDTPQSQPCR